MDPRNRAILEKQRLEVGAGGRCAMTASHTINDARDRYVVLLDHFGQMGASAPDRKAIREASGHTATGGMVANDSDLVGGHLCEWVGGATGPKTHIRLTAEGRFWAAAVRAATERGFTLQEYIARALEGLANQERRGWSVSDLELDR
jgi:hypothetical protein